jgi:hypothetical protein
MLLSESLRHPVKSLLSSWCSSRTSATSHLLEKISSCAMTLQSSSAELVLSVSTRGGRADLIPSTYHAHLFHFRNSSQVKFYRIISFISAIYQHHIARPCKQARSLSQMNAMQHKKKKNAAVGPSISSPQRLLFPALTPSYMPNTVIPLKPMNAYTGYLSSLRQEPQKSNKPSVFRRVS